MTRTILYSAQDKTRMRAKARAAVRKAQRRDHCERLIRRSDGTVSECLLEWDHDILIWCQDDRARAAAERLEIERERIAALPYRERGEAWNEVWRADVA